MKQIIRKKKKPPELEDKNKIVAFILIFVCDEKGTLGVEYNHWIIEINICFLPHCLAQYIVGTSSTAANRKSFRQFVFCNRGGAIRAWSLMGGCHACRL